MKLNLSTITLILTVTLFFNLLLQVEGKRENFTTHGKAYSIDPTMDSSYNLISKVDQFSELVDTSWDPESPPFSGYFYASITASGLGKLDFSFSEGSFTDYKEIIRIPFTKLGNCCCSQHIKI